MQLFYRQVIVILHLFLNNNRACEAVAGYSNNLKSKIMKKLSLVLGFAFMASMVFAQNTSTTNQNGTENKSSVAQVGTLNTATVDQIGAKNFVTVDSKGKSNSAVVEQNGSQNGFGSIPNWGYIKQDGEANTAVLKEGKKGGATSSDADGFIDQKGNDNHATLEILGQYHNLINHGITQIQDRETKGNIATVVQSSYNNDMDVFQKGSENLVNGSTAGSNNQFFVDQTGIKNTATVIQVGNNNGEWGYYWGWHQNDRNWNVLSQTGNDNVGSVIQASDNKFKMTQVGDQNTAKIEEQGNNVVTILQDGNKNIIGGIVNCVPTDVAIFATGASMDATQLGDNNKLFVNTAGALTVLQKGMILGDGNTIKYTQTGAGVVALVQEGDKNLIWLKNTSVTTPMDVDVDQIGNGNTVASFENGVATSCAKFAGSHLDVDQIGNLNSLHLDSTDPAASVDVLQQGNSNWASVTQSN